MQAPCSVCPFLAGFSRLVGQVCHVMLTYGGMPMCSITHAHLLISLMWCCAGIKTLMIAMGMLMVFIANKKSVSAQAFKAFATVMLVVSVWLLQFMISSVVPPVYKWFQLTTQGQFGLFARHRRAWYTLIMLSAVESFLVTLIASVVYNYHGWSALMLYGALYSGVGCLSIVGWATVLSRNTGRVRLVVLMYALAVFPGLAIAQMACVVWGKSLVWVILAATAFQIGMVRLVCYSPILLLLLFVGMQLQHGNFCCA